MPERAELEEPTKVEVQLPAARRRSDTKFSLHLISSLTEESNITDSKSRESAYLDWINSLVKSVNQPDLVPSVDYSHLMEGQKVQSSLHLAPSIKDALHNLRIEFLQCGNHKRVSISLIVGFALSFAINNHAEWAAHIPSDGRCSDAEFSMAISTRRTSIMLPRMLLLSCELILENYRKQGCSPSMEALKMTGLAYGLSCSAEWTPELTQSLGVYRTKR